MKEAYSVKEQWTHLGPTRDVPPTPLSKLESMNNEPLSHHIPNPRINLSWDDCFFEGDVNS